MLTQGGRPQVSHWGPVIFSVSTSGIIRYWPNGGDGMIGKVIADRVGD